MAFVSLRDADGLAWRQASLFGRAIEISRGDQLVGILRLRGWAAHCDAGCADGMWQFKREGFFWRRVVIMESPGGKSVGTFQYGLNSRLVLLSGATYLWKRISFWRQEMAFLTASEFTIIKCEPKRFSFRDSGITSVAREYSELADLPLLIMLGTYLTVLAHRRAQQG